LKREFPMWPQTCCTAQAGFKLTVPLLQPPEFWDYRFALSHPEFCCFFPSFNYFVSF
jgi:hypothetical protein